ncbi:MAG: hypothetical protein ACE5I9_09615 [Candidatus Methylomirabilales bacterium]
MGHIHQKVCLRAEEATTIRMLVNTGETFYVIPPSRSSSQVRTTETRKSSSLA